MMTNDYNFEKHIINLCKAYEMDGRAFIEKEEGLKNKNNQYRNKLRVDFIGFENTGRFVGIECKATKHNMFNFEELRIHQYKYLKKVHQNNGLAMLLIYFFNHDIVKRIIFNNKLIQFLDSRIKETYRQKVDRRTKLKRKEIYEYINYKIDIKDTSGDNFIFSALDFMKL